MSSLAWQSNDTDDRRKNLVVFENGAVSYRDYLPEDKEIPVPPGHSKRIKERQKNFNVMTYDRMRVVTTELRRLVDEGREIELRLSPTSIVWCENLARILKWV